MTVVPRNEIISCQSSALEELQGHLGAYNVIRLKGKEGCIIPDLAVWLNKSFSRWCPTTMLIPSKRCAFTHNKPDRAYEK